MVPERRPVPNHILHHKIAMMVKIYEYFISVLGCRITSIQKILGHKQIDTTLGYARLYDGTLAADYYSAMHQVERQLSLPEDERKEPPRIGELIALADALREGALNPAQTEIVRALRQGLGALENVTV